MEIVDAHTHIFSPEVIAGRERYLGREAWFWHLYQHPRARLATAEELLASMATARIDRSVVVGFPWRDPGLCREHNDYLAASCRASDGRLAWLAIVSPAAPGAAAEAERALAAGAVGLGELNADAQGFDLAQPAPLLPVTDICIAAERPLLLHVSEPLGHAYPGKGTATPDRLLPLLAARPALRVIAAHWGGGLPFYELMPEVAAAAANVVYDSAASTYLYDFRVFRTVVDLVGAARVLFASDYPVLRQDRFLRRVRDAGLTEPELPLVLGENACRLFGLPPLDAPEAGP